MKCRIFPLGVFYVFIYDMLALLCLGFVVFLPSQKESWLLTFSLIMFVVFPLIFTIYILSFSLDTVIIDSNGIKRLHYGKMKKELLWSEIITFKLYPKNDNQGWIYISNHTVEYNFFTSTFMMFDKKTICLKSSDKIIKELKKYLKDTI